MTNLTEDQIRSITQFAMDGLGAEATYQRVHQVVREVVERFERAGSLRATATSVKRFLLICLSADSQRNEEALEQGLKDSGCRMTARFEHQLGTFHVLLVAVDCAGAKLSHEQIRARLAGAGVQTGVKMILQTEDVLRK